MPNEPVPGERRDRIVVLVAIGLMLAITVPLANYLNIWIDEGYTLYTTSGDFTTTIKTAREFEMQPAVYFAELWVWRQLSDSITLARLNSVFFAAAAVWFVYLAARRWLPNLPAGVVAGLYAFNAYLLWSAVEIRPYSLVQLFCALLLVLFYDGFYQEQPKRVAQILYALTALTALYTYYFLGFVLVALAAPLLMERRWTRLTAYVVWMAGVGLFFIPEILMVRNHVESVVAIKEAPSGIFRSFEYVAGHVFSMPFGLPPLPKTVRWVAGLGMLGAVLVSAVVLYKRFTPQARALWAILAILGACYGYVVHSVMREDDLTQRHLMILIIPSTLALLSIVGLYTARARRLAIGVFAVLWLGFNGYATWWMFHPLAKSGDYRRVSAYLNEVQRPGDPIAVLTSHAALPMRQYFLGSGQIYPLPYEDTYDRYIIERWRFDSPAHAREAIQPAVTADGKLWLYTDRPADSEYFGVDLNFEFLEQVLHEDFEMVSEKDFFNAKVRQFKRKVPMSAPANKAPPEMTSTPAPTDGAATTAHDSSVRTPAATRRGPPPRREGTATGVFGAPTSGGNPGGSRPR